MDKLIGKELGPYRVETHLDKGGTADIYKAYQPAVDRHVALKVLSPEYTRQPAFLDRFLQEAQLIARLEHPHIVPVYDFGEIDGRFYIAMRLVESGTVDERFHGQPFSLPEIRQIISQVGDALDYAHAEGVVHRDIKPKNILLDHRDNVLLTDFGVAKDLDSDAKLTMLGRTVGTPSYMSPEQILGDPLDGRTDIYSLGVVLFQLATGYLPFQGSTPEETCNFHLYNPIPSARAQNPEIPLSLDHVISKTLAKRAQERYSHAGDMVRALLDATSEESRQLNQRSRSDTERTVLSPIVKPIHPPQAIHDVEATLNSLIAKDAEPYDDDETMVHLPSTNYDADLLKADDKTLPQSRSRKLLALLTILIVIVLIGILLASISAAYFISP